MGSEEKKNVSYEGLKAPLTKEDAEKVLEHMQGWELVGNSIERTFKFADFMKAMEFANRIAAIAEQENHHPDLHISWGKVRVELTTHSVGGLSTNDFIVAAKINQLLDDTESRQAI